MWGWIGAATGIIGGTLVALNFNLSKFGYIFFIASSISWLIQATKNQDNPLAILNIFFLLINGLGIYHWFF